MNVAIFWVALIQSWSRWICPYYTPSLLEESNPLNWKTSKIPLPAKHLWIAIGIYSWSYFPCSFKTFSVAPWDGHQGDNLGPELSPTQTCISLHMYACPPGFGILLAMPASLLLSHSLSTLPLSQGVVLWYRQLAVEPSDDALGSLWSKIRIIEPLLSHCGPVFIHTQLSYDSVIYW